MGSDEEFKPWRGLGIFMQLSPCFCDHLKVRKEEKAWGTKVATDAHSWRDHSYGEQIALNTPTEVSPGPGAQTQMYCSFC